MVETSGVEGLSQAHEVSVRLQFRGRAPSLGKVRVSQRGGLLLFAALLLWPPVAQGYGPSHGTQNSAEPSERKGFLAVSLGFIFTPEPDETSRTIGLMAGVDHRLGVGWTVGLRYVDRPPAVPALTSRRQDYALELFAGPQLYLGATGLPIRVRLGADLGVLHGPRVPEEGEEADTLVLPFIRPTLGLGFLIRDGGFIELAGGLMGLSAPTFNLSAGLRF
jgi:hypothetical protein